MRHTEGCPCRDGKCQPPCEQCTCGAFATYPPQSPAVQLGHTPECSRRHSDVCTCGGGLPEMAPGPAQGASASPSSAESPYADVEYARTLLQRAEAAFEAGESGRGEFLLRLSGEARLLAELQGRWEYSA